MAIDPFLGKAVSSAVQSSMHTNGASSPAHTPTETLFKNVMTEMGSQQDLSSAFGVNAKDIDPNTPKFDVISAEGFDPIPEHLVTGVQEPNGKQLILEMFENMNHTGNKLETMFNKLSDDKGTLSMQELFRVQSYIYKCVQEIEVGVKVASEGVSSLRTVLNTQIQ